MGTTLRASAAAVASAGVITGAMVAAPDGRAARALSAPPTHPVYFQNVGNEQNLEPVEGSALPATPVVTLTPDGTPAQQWTPAKQPDGGYYIVSRLGNGDMCLNAGGSTGDVQLQTCTGSSSEEWNYVPDGGAVRFENRRYQGRYLSEGGIDGPARLAPGDSGADDQRWRLPA